MAYTAKLLIRDVLTAAKTDTVRDAAQKMKKAGVGCIAVIDGKKLAGVFTERDVLNRVVAAGLDPAATPLSQVMTPDPVAIDSEEKLDKVFATLAERRFRHLPITEGGAIVGMVSLTDLASVLREVYKEDRYLQYFAEFIKSGAGKN